jgi:tRNA U55 pseudouridine synthase TruB
VRSGEDVIPAERNVEIHSIDPVATGLAHIGVRKGKLLVGGASAITRSLVVAIEIRCGSGTYIRSLARDLGEAVESCATLLALVRTAVGPFTLMDSVGLKELEHAAVGQAAACLYAPDVVLEDRPACVISAADREDFVHGRHLAVEPSTPGIHRFYDSCGEFLGLADSLGKAWGKRRVMLSLT